MLLRWLVLSRCFPMDNTALVPFPRLFIPNVGSIRLTTSTSHCSFIATGQKTLESGLLLSQSELMVKKHNWWKLPRQVSLATSTNLRAGFGDPTHIRARGGCKQQSLALSLLGETACGRRSKSPHTAYAGRTHPNKSQHGFPFGISE